MKRASHRHDPRASRAGIRPVHLLLCLAVPLAACASGNADAPSVAIRDSAGIRIAEHSLGDPQSDRTGSWIVPAEPELEITSAEGQELYRIHGADLLSDGRVVIASRADNQLLLFDQDGAFVRRFGGEGRGPGEFMGLTNVWRFGDDRIIAFELGNRRYAVFDTTGAVERTGRTGPQLTIDGTMIVVGLGGFTSAGAALVSAQRPGSPQQGISRPQLELLLLDSAGEVGPRFGRYAGTEMFSGPPRGGFAGLFSSPFAHATLFAANGDLVAIADNAAYEVRLSTAEGRLATIIRAHVPELPVTDEAVRLATAEQLQRPVTEVSSEAVSAGREAYPHPTLPALHALYVDRDGRVFVSEFAPPGAASRRVAVYLEDGTLQGTFALPRGVELLSAWEERIVVRRRTAEGFDAVSVFRLHTSLPASEARPDAAATGEG